eukprot:5622074-Prymnesium_polylepis.1
MQSAHVAPPSTAPYARRRGRSTATTLPPTRLRRHRLRRVRRDPRGHRMHTRRRADGPARPRPARRRSAPRAEHGT